MKNYIHAGKLIFFFYHEYHIPLYYLYPTINILVYVLHLPIFTDVCPPSVRPPTQFCKLQRDLQTSIMTHRETPQHYVEFNICLQFLR